MPGNDKVWRQLVNLVNRLDGVRVQAGITDGEIAEIGLFHEYGTATIPERSWLRSTFRDKREQLVAIQAKIAKAILELRIDERRAMELLGAWAAGAIKATITADGDFAPLAPATIAAKGSAKPLIETSRLVNSITYVVVP
jgi:hypothetical protein